MRWCRTLAAGCRRSRLDVSISSRISTQRAATLTQIPTPTLTQILTPTLTLTLTLTLALPLTLTLTLTKAPLDELISMQRAALLPPVDGDGNGDGDGDNQVVSAPPHPGREP